MSRRTKKKRIIGLACRTIFALALALLFLTPIVLTVANSFMSASEISSNYGAIFQKTDTGGKVFIGKTVNLKLIPDMGSRVRIICLSSGIPLFLWCRLSSFSLWWRFLLRMDLPEQKERFRQLSFLRILF